MTLRHSVQEKEIHPASGWLVLILGILGTIGGIAMSVIGGILTEGKEGFLPEGALCFGGMALFFFCLILLAGLKILKPNEALVLTLFGKYYGSLKTNGFFWVNPFCSAVNGKSVAMQVSKDGNVSMSSGGKKLSLRAMTLVNDKQKINDADGNPIEIGVVVIWRIVNTARAVFAVDSYTDFISTQCDAAIRQVARQYPYDVGEDDEKSLRGSSQEISRILIEDLQTRVEMAGIEIMDARISHLAYAPEIAAAMLQRQQATAIIAARQKIVEGAVGMVEMALQQLSDKNVVELDDERKAQMVSNLLVVLCGNKDAQPIVNSGSIY